MRNAPRLRFGHTPDSESISRELETKLNPFLAQLTGLVGSAFTKGNSPTAIINPEAGGGENFFLLPGRYGGQIAYGATEAGGSLTLGSANHGTKGKVYLGVARSSAYDETLNFLGVGTGSPAARIHLTNSALGTATVGATGTVWQRFTYATTDKLDIVPLLNASGVVDLALNVSNGSVQFIDSSIGTAGLRIAFSSNNSFVQAGRINSSGVVQNRNLQLGGMNATIGASFVSVFQANTFTTAVGSDEGGNAIAANDSMTAMNLSAADYLTSAAANKTSLLVGPRAAGSVPLVVEQASTTVNAFEIRKASAGSSPAKTLGSRKFAVTPGLGSLTSEASFVGYISGVETFRLSPIASGAAQWAFEGPTGIVQLAHASATSQWSDSVAAITTRLEIGGTNSSVRYAALTSQSGAIFDRFGITSLATSIENAGLGGGAAGISPAAGILQVRNRSGVGTILLVLRALAAQTGRLVSLQDSAGAVLGGFTASGAYEFISGAGSGKVWTSDANGVGSWQAAAGGSNILLDGTNHTDTLNTAVTRGALVVGNSTPKWTSLPIGSANTVLRSDGTDPSYGAIDHNYISNRTRSEFVDAIRMPTMSGTVTYAFTGTAPNAYYRATFSSSTDRSAGFSWMVPGDYVAGTSIEAFLYFTATGTSDAADFYVDFGYLSLTDADDPVAAENTLSNIALSHPTSATTMRVVSLGTFSTGLAANEFLRCRIARDVTEEIAQHGLACQRTLNVIGIRFDYTADM